MLTQSFSQSNRLRLHEKPDYDYPMSDTNEPNMTRYSGFQTNKIKTYFELTDGPAIELAGGKAYDAEAVEDDVPDVFFG